MSTRQGFGSGGPEAVLEVAESDSFPARSSVVLLHNHFSNSASSAGYAPAPRFYTPTRSPAVYAVVSVTLWILFVLSCAVTVLSFLTLLGHPCMFVVHRLRLSDRGARFGTIQFWLMFGRGTNVLLIFAWLIHFAVNRQNAQANDYWLPLAWVLVHLALAGKLYVQIISLPREEAREPQDEDAVEAQAPVPFLHNVPIMKVEQPCPAGESPTATSNAKNTYAIPISAFEMVMAAEEPWRSTWKGNPTVANQGEQAACPPTTTHGPALSSTQPATGPLPHLEGHLINIYYAAPEPSIQSPPVQTAASASEPDSGPSQPGQTPVVQPSLASRGSGPHALSIDAAAAPSADS